jgi:hypothetical protein
MPSSRPGRTIILDPNGARKNLPLRLCGQVRAFFHVRAGVELVVVNRDACDPSKKAVALTGAYSATWVSASKPSRSRPVALLSSQLGTMMPIKRRSQFAVSILAPS